MKEDKIGNLLVNIGSVPTPEKKCLETWPGGGIPPMLAQDIHRVAFTGHVSEEIIFEAIASLT